MVVRYKTGCRSYARPADSMFGEPYTLLLPHFVDPTKRAIIWAHGANGLNTDSLDAHSKGIPAALFRLAQEGFVVLSCDFSGPFSYGNDAALAAVVARWAELKLTGLCATDKFIGMGASMGTLTMLRYAKEHPTQVSGMNFWIPLVDTEAVRTSNAVGVRATINSSWGMPVGSYIGGADQTPLPANAKPIGYAHTLTDIPTHMWYSTADLVSANMATFLAAHGPNAHGHITSTTEGHTDANILLADVDAIIAFAESVD